MRFGGPNRASWTAEVGSRPAGDSPYGLYDLPGFLSAQTFARRDDPPEERSHALGFRCAMNSLKGR